MAKGKDLIEQRKEKVKKADFGWTYIRVRKNLIFINLEKR